MSFSAPPVKNVAKNNFLETTSLIFYLDSVQTFLSAAIGQGITWVVLVVLHHLVHFLFKRNLSEKNLPDWESNRSPSVPQPSTYPLSYRAIVVIYVKIVFIISQQTLDQYWSTLVLMSEATWVETFWNLMVFFTKSHFWNDASLSDSFSKRLDNFWHLSKVSRF